MLGGGKGRRDELGPVVDKIQGSGCWVAVLVVMGHCLSRQVPDFRPLQATVSGEADPLLQVRERLALTRAVRRAGLLLREL